jgi:hypothetical protein
MPDYTLDDFLSAILLDELPEEETNYVFCVQDSPIGQKSVPWVPITEAELHPKMRRASRFSGYISTMIASRDKKSGRYRNRQSDFYGLNMIVLDDVGDKVSPNNLTPTYIIETSSGNYQWGYVLDSPITDPVLAERLVRSVYESGELTDAGGKMFNKFVRLPVGINNKVINDSGDVNTFAVRLVELNDIYYNCDSLLAGFGIGLADVAVTREPEIMCADGVPDRDPLLSWLGSRGLIIADDGSDWVQIECPWHSQHSNPLDRHAGYSPLGRGAGFEDYRSFKCHHGHCAGRKIGELLMWADERHAPASHVFDPIARLRAQYVYLKYSNEVADVTVGAQYQYPIVALSNFKSANRRYITGERGGKQYYGELWLEDARTVICDGRLYEPGGEMVIRDPSRGVLLNTFRAPEHRAVSGLPRTYIEHIAWLIPSESERAIFHLWVAQKLQRPRSRSYALVMVSDLAEGESGEKFGTGRSTVGNILRSVFQAGVNSVELGDISGTSGGQSQYNDWAADCQLCIVEETKECADNFRDELQSYEKIKQVIDTQPTLGVRVKPKYGRIYVTTLFANFLFFSNHSNAIQLPEGDRRFMVIDNNKGRRSFDEYAELQRFLNDPDDIARVYWWYMSMDISDFDHIYPIMTPAKNRMMVQSKSTLDEIWNQTVEHLAGGLVTQKILVNTCLLFVEPGDELTMKIASFVRAKWKKLAFISEKYKITIQGVQHRVRIIKNNDEIAERYNNGEHEWMRKELSKNR